MSIIRSIIKLSIIGFVFINSANADVTIDHQYKGKDWNKFEYTSPIQKQFSEEIYNKYEPAVYRDLARDGISSKPLIGSIDFGRLVWDGDIFYIIPVNYISAAQSESDKKQNWKHTNAIPGGGVCSIFLYNSQFERVAKVDADLPDANHHTWCNGINGIGSARKQDGVLLAVSYYLTDKSPAHTVKEIGNGWKDETLLFHLSKENGKVKFTQDDRCLGNPNHFKDILSARKALAKCPVH